MTLGINLKRPEQAASPPMNHYSRPPPDEEYTTELVVDIYRAVNIDKSMENLNGYPRAYKVVGFVDGPQTQFQTKVKKGEPNPAWLETITLKNYEPYCKYSFLHLEVIRVSKCMTDPGTSRGIKVVGRTKIPLPKIGKKVFGPFGLVTMENGCVSSESGGHIVVGVEIKEIPKLSWLRKRYRDRIY